MKINIRYRGDKIVIVLKKYNYRAIVIKILYIKYLNNAYLLITRIIIIIIAILITIFLYILYFD